MGAQKFEELRREKAAHDDEVGREWHPASCRDASGGASTTKIHVQLCDTKVKERVRQDAETHSKDKRVGLGRGVAHTASSSSFS